LEVFNLISFQAGYEKEIMEQRGTRLEGKVAIVTGAGTATDVDGTGQAMAILFARHGAKVIVADMSEENAQKTIDTIEAAGGAASLFTVDVTKNAECKAMVDAAVERYGGLDILINNVGIGRGGTAVEVSEEEWDLVLNVNLKSMMLTSKHAIPIMIEGGGGTIVNLSSINGLRAGWIADVHYSAAKGGVVAMTKNMAVHHGRDNIRVNAIAPGHIHGSIVSKISEERREMRRRAAPLGTEGTAWDVAWAALFLASDEARWISGIVLPVDAGLIATTPLAMLPHLR
jgi:NAD(P)-dependent dehydrogenase (short-subunit alcohol dehydrogenase family)